MDRKWPSKNLSTIVFLESGKVDLLQAWRFLRFGRRRRMSSDLLKRLTPRQAAHDLVLGGFGRQGCALRRALCRSGKIQRYVYIELKPGADLPSIHQAIESDPLFLDEETLVLPVDSVAALEDRGN